MTCSKLVAVVNSSNLVLTPWASVGTTYNCQLTELPCVQQCLLSRLLKRGGIVIELLSVKNSGKEKDFCEGGLGRVKREFWIAYWTATLQRRKACQPEILIILGISELLLVHLLSCVLAALMAQKTFLFCLIKSLGNDQDFTYVSPLVLNYISAYLLKTN